MYKSSFSFLIKEASTLEGCLSLPYKTRYTIVYFLFTKDLSDFLSTITANLSIIGIQGLFQNNLFKFIPINSPNAKNSPSSTLLSFKQQVTSRSAVFKK